MDWYKLLSAILKYQYGIKIDDKVLMKLKYEVSKNTGRLRRVYQDNRLLFTIDASTGFAIPTYYGGLFLKRYLPFPKYRVIIADEAVEFVARGKSVFNKFVIEVDREILPKDLVLVVDKQDNLIATGEAVLSGIEMLQFNYGVAVKVKHSRDL